MGRAYSPAGSHEFNDVSIMIDPAYISTISLANEAVVEKRFKKMTFRPERLDYQGPRRRPEFLVSDSAGPVVVCEVKTIFSAGYLHDRNAHASTADPKLLNTGAFSVEVNREKIDENLADAVDKYRTLVSDRPELRDLPLVVALFFDEFADHFDLYPSKMERFPEVSGILKVEKDHAIRTAAETMTLAELEERIETGNMGGLPPSSKMFRLVENECAAVRLPRHFVDTCLT